LGFAQFERNGISTLMSAAETFGDKNMQSNHLPRRTLLSLGLAAMGAAALRGSKDAWAQSAKPVAAADYIIVLWMNGGPSHLDTFDPKPGRKVMGPMKSITTAIPNVQFGEFLPLLAKEAKKLAVLRGLTSKEGSHERAQSLGHTGYSPNPTAAYPSLGSWASKSLGRREPELPAYVSIGGPGGPSGFFGQAHAPFVVSNPGLAPDNTDMGVSDERFRRRTEALTMLEDAFVKKTSGPLIPERRAVYDSAFRLMRSPKLRAFDLEDEPAATISAYGDSTFGRGCLTARRLVEAGVRYVEVTLDGWDTHQDNHGRVKKLCGTLDPAMSSLVKDLADRKLLDRTLVLCLGEFGRTPTLSSDEGRDHHPAAFSALLAGGGIKVGQAVGQTDEDGNKVVADKIATADLFATLASRLGLDPAETVQAPSGRPITLTDGGSVVQKLLK
jgi:hypothetical protein